MTNFLHLSPAEQAKHVAELTAQAARVDELEAQIKKDRGAALWAKIGGYEDSLKHGLSEMQWSDDLTPSLSSEALESLHLFIDQSQQPTPQGDSEPQLSPAEKLNALRATASPRPRPGEV